jgi:hypothetical protein
VVDPIDVLLFLNLELVHPVHNVLLEGTDSRNHAVFLVFVLAVDALDLSSVVFLDLPNGGAVVLLKLGDSALPIFLFNFV